MTGYGVTLPILMFHIERFALTEGASMRQAAMHVGLMTGIFAFMQFLFAPFWGRWSDAFGRRPILLLGLSGYMMMNIVFSLGTTLYMLYGARILGGVMSAAVLPTAAAYVADETSPAMRGRAMAWLCSAVSLGLVLGPILGLMLAKLTANDTINFGSFSVSSLSFPFLGAASLGFSALILATVALPEVVDKKKNSRKATTTKHKSGWNISTFHESLPKILLLSLLWSFCHALFEGTFGLHGKRLMRFGPQELSMVLIVCGLVMGVAQATVVGTLILRFGEQRIVFVGLGLMGISMMLLMTSLSLFVILVFVALFGTGTAMINPSLASWVSKSNAERSGSALGLQTSANGLGQALGPILGGALLAWSIHLPYVVSAVLLIASAAVVHKMVSSGL
jgi:DHA1 family multidrug resistance protein-like MFS transporter